MRKFERSPLNAYGLLKANEYHKMQIKDFSQMGVGIVCPTQMSLKTFVSIIYRNEIGVLITMKSYVKHIRKISEGKFFIGLQFVGIESKESWQELSSAKLGIKLVT